MKSLGASSAIGMLLCSSPPLEEHTHPLAKLPPPLPKAPYDEILVLPRGPMLIYDKSGTRIWMIVEKYDPNSQNTEQESDK